MHHKILRRLCKYTPACAADAEFLVPILKLKRMHEWIRLECQENVAAKTMAFQSLHVA